MGQPQISPQVEGVNRDEFWMRRALKLAQAVIATGEVPVAALLVKGDRLVSAGINGAIRHHDPTFHAEIQAIRRAARRLQNYRLLDTTLYVTLEPCPMCAGALVHARIKRVVFGAYDPRTGACGTALDVLTVPSLNHRVDMTGGVLGEACGAFLRAFFRQKRLTASLMGSQKSVSP